MLWMRYKKILKSLNVSVSVRLLCFLSCCNLSIFINGPHIMTYHEIKKIILDRPCRILFVLDNIINRPFFVQTKFHHKIIH